MIRAQIRQFSRVNFISRAEDNIHNSQPLNAMPKVLAKIHPQSRNFPKIERQNGMNAAPSNNNMIHQRSTYEKSVSPR